jgi:hypothetical protein
MMLSTHKNLPLDRTTGSGRRPFLLGKEYRPRHEQNRMQNEGNAPAARINFMQG